MTKAVLIWALILVDLPSSAFCQESAFDTFLVTFDYETRSCIFRMNPTTVPA